MTTLPRSAVDCISPAIETTQAMMFRPYRWHRWWRVGLIGMATAVIGTANGCNLGGLGDFKQAFGRDPKAAELLTKLQSYISPAQLAFFVTVLVVGLTVLTLVHIYVNSVARFMMFDAMTTGAVRIRQGWTKWQGEGVRLFGFQLALSLFVTVILSSMAYLFSAGMRGGSSPGSAVAGFFAFMGGVWLFSIIVIAIHVVSTDFAVPMMALEDAGMVETLKRIWRMVAETPVDYIVYALMKLLLTIGIAIALVIVQFVVLIIPLLIMVFVMVLVVGAAAGSGSPVLMVVLAGMALSVFLTVMIFLVALIAAPTYVFFQAYALEFFSDRYPKLKAALHPAPPSLPVVELPPLPAM